MTVSPIVLLCFILIGKVDTLLFTVGFDYNSILEEYIKIKAGFIAPVYSYPGEDELESLAINALWVARGKELVKEYLG